MLVCLLLIVSLLAPKASYARWMNPSTGRFHTMDTFEGDQRNPQSLHKYTYAHANPVDLKDPTGHFVDSISMLVGTGENLDLTRRDAARVDYQRTVAMNRLNSVTAQYIINTVIAVGATAVTVGGYELATGYSRSQVRNAVKTKLEKLEQKNQGQLLFHYTTFERAQNIIASQYIYPTAQFSDPNSGQLYPLGAYATDIGPIENYTRRQLANILYFDPSRASSADLSAAVVILNKRPKGFSYVAPHHYCRPQGDVYAIDMLPNPMRP